MQHACANLQHEIFVVDNASTDGSIPFLKPLFPNVHWIENKDNPGFGTANNQALKLATGEFVLFLNPDTLVPEDCFDACIDFLHTQKDAGALGIRMLDGSGRFLPESKRAFPSPGTSFFKLIGLASMFPTSPLFARYYLGHLSEQENHASEVLAGAFMMVRKKVLDVTGGFDEQFFMYGEDIDLSYRIEQTPIKPEGGFWKNYYFAGSSIIHFKGESTKKGTLNYVLLFYKAMVQFVKKHYKSRQAGLYTFFIYLAIAVRGFASFAGGLIGRAGLPLMDLMLSGGSLLLVWKIWSRWVRPDVDWVPGMMPVSLVVFVALFLVTAALTGLYSKWYAPFRTFRTMVFTILAALALYSLLPESWRFSRGIVLFGGVLSGGLILLFREIIRKAGWLKVEQTLDDQQQTLVAGTKPDYRDIETMLAPYMMENRLLGRLSLAGEEEEGLMPLESWINQNKSIPAKELIFTISKNFPLKSVINCLDPDSHLSYFFHYSQSRSIVGSDDPSDVGEWLSAHPEFRLSIPSVLNSKRVLDMMAASGFILFFPLLAFASRKPLGLLQNSFKVLTGQATWIGYLTSEPGLPALKKGILDTNALPASKNQGLSLETKLALDKRYALDYHYWVDARLIRRGFRYLGEKGSPSI